MTFILPLRNLLPAPVSKIMEKVIAEKPGLIGDDETLVDAFQAGQKAAFDALVMRYRDKIYNLCYWFLGDSQDAGDAAQDTFISAFIALKKFRREASFSTWLHRIAVNTCKNKRKSFSFRFRRQTEPLDLLTGEEMLQGRLRDPQLANSPADALEQKERLRLIQKAITRLSSDKRAVVILRDVDGLSYEEISGITGLALGTVKSKLARARAELAGKLKGRL